MERALSLEEDALASREDSGTTRRSTSWSNLAGFAFLIQDFRRAIKYLSIRLAAARAANDEESVLQCVSWLGACYAATGAWSKALDFYGEGRLILREAGREDSILFATIELGHAQVLVDLKRFDEARPLLLRARELMVSLGSDTGLLDEVQRRLDRESSGPPRGLCTSPTATRAQRVDDRALALKPPPIRGPWQRAIPNNSVVRRGAVRLSKLATELDEDSLQTRYKGSGAPSVPNAMFLPLKFEYVDDVHEFEIKWSAFKQERRDAERRAEVQAAWEDVRDRARFQEGRFQGDSVDSWRMLASSLG